MASSSNPTTATSDSSPQIKLCTEKLNDSNFSAWRYDMQNALGYMNLDDFIKPHTDELLKRSDYKAKLKQVTTFIRLHLGREDSTRFVDDLDTYDPKSLWDSIISHYATKSIENAANVMEKLHDIVFVEGEMQKKHQPLPPNIPSHDRSQQFQIRQEDFGSRLGFLHPQKTTRFLLSIPYTSIFHTQVWKLRNLHDYLSQGS